MPTMLAVAALTDFQPKTFGIELLRLRNDANLSQRLLGQLSEVSNTAISDLEKGDAPAPWPPARASAHSDDRSTGSGDVEHGVRMEPRPAEQDRQGVAGIAWLGRPVVLRAHRAEFRDRPL